MPDEMSGDDARCASLREVGRADGISAVRRLSGGVIADAWLISWADGTSAVGKIVNGAAPDLFRTEADGADGWLGRLRQVNTWNADGHEFFAEHRLLRYLTEPPAEQALTADDRRALERLCARLPELIPPMPAVLTHGDLWTGNLVSQPGGRITVIDPAVSYTWAEVDLSMLWGNARPPRTGSSLSIRNSTPRRPDGRTGCPCCTCVSCSAASRISAPPRPMTWGGSVTPSARSTSTDPRRRC
jgi:hypothetical protein